MPASNGETILDRLRAGKSVPVRGMAETLGCHPNTLWKAIREGEIQAANIGGRATIPSPEGLRLVGLGNPEAA